MEILTYNYANLALLHALNVLDLKSVSAPVVNPQA